MVKLRKRKNGRYSDMPNHYLTGMWVKAKPFYEYLKRTTNLPNMIICGILGNIAQESGFDPKAYYKGHLGYLQNDANILKYIKTNFGGMSHDLLMNYLIAGLNGKLPNTNSGSGSMLYERFNEFLSGIPSISSIEDAVDLWETAYEKSNGLNLDKRLDYGVYFYNLIKDLPEEQDGYVVYNGNNTEIYLLTDPIEEVLQKNPALQSIHEKNLQRLKKYPSQIKTNTSVDNYILSHKKGGRLVKKHQYGGNVVKIDSISLRRLNKGIYEINPFIPIISTLYKKNFD